MDVIIYEVGQPRERKHVNRTWSRSEVLGYMRIERALNGNHSTSKRTSEEGLQKYDPDMTDYHQHTLKLKEALKIIGANHEQVQASDDMTVEDLEELVHKLMRHQVRNYHPDTHPQYAELFKEKTEAYERLKHLTPRHTTKAAKSYVDAMCYLAGK